MSNEGQEPIPMHLWCPICHTKHIDIGEFATKPHRTHSCQNCGLNWQPCLLSTVGVQFLPGCKNDEQPTRDATRRSEGVHLPSLVVPC